MREFNAVDFENYKGRRAITMPERAHLTLEARSTKPLRLFGLRESEKVLLEVGEKIFYRKKIKGFSAIHIEPTGATEFTLAYHLRELQPSEYNSGEKAPVIDMPEASNLVLKMRQIAMAHHRQSMYPTLDPEDAGFQSYEYDDDVEILFEEEALEAAIEARKAQEAPEAEESEESAPHESSEEGPPSQAKAAE